MDTLPDITEFKPVYSEQYYENLRQLKRYFEFTIGIGAYNICTAKDQRLIKEVDEELKQQVPGIEILFLETREIGNDKPVEKSIMQQLRDLKHEEPATKGIVIPNLDFVISDDPKTLTYLNFQRESLLELNTPLLFWLSQDNIKRMTSEAIDLFSVKQQGIIEFQDIPEYTTRPMLADRFDEIYLTKEEIEQLQVKIELLNRQLKEAEEKGYDKKRIIDDIVIPLLKAYRENDLFTPALCLYEKYKYDFDWEDIAHLEEAIKTLDGSGHWNEAELLCNKLLSLEEKRYGSQSTESALTLRFLSVLYKKNGSLNKSVQFAQSAVEIAEGIFKDDTSKISPFYLELARSYNDIGQYEKSSIYLNKIATEDLKIKDRIILLTDRLDNLYRQQKFELALDLGREAMNLAEQHLDSNAPVLSRVYNHLANIYSDTGQFQESLKYHFKNVSINEVIFGKQSKNYATGIGNISDVNRKLGDLAKALEYGLEALDIRQNILNPNHPDIGISYSRMSFVYFGLKEYQKAKEFLEKALTIFVKTLPPDHPEIKGCKEAITIVLRKIPITKPVKIGRNDPCPCGSGKKYKNCHGKDAV